MTDIDLGTPNQLPRPDSLDAALEAILFFAGDAVEIEELAKTLQCTAQEVQEAADLLEALYRTQNRGIKLMRFDNSLQLSTQGKYLPYIENLLSPVRKKSLSQAALETLSVVAYKQPVTRLEIEQIRGVHCEYVLSILLRMDLIAQVGHKDVIGRPVLYGTTQNFLRHFGLSDLSDLPPLENEEEFPAFEEI